MEEAVLCRLERAGIECFGWARFDQVLPLLPCRAAGRLPQGARGVLVCLFPYYTGEYPQRNLSRYAVIKDYHQVAGEMLAGLAKGLGESFPGHAFVPFTDNSPIREVAAAWRAGLGWVGKNGQLIHPKYGSRVFVGCVVTTLEQPASAPMEMGCMGCGACLRACPTGALADGGGLQQERCRSFITQKKRGLSSWQEEQIRLGGMAWGCDICTDICPHNKHTPLTPIKDFYQSILPVLTRETLEPAMKEKPYGYRGKKVLERNLALLAGEK